jgi:hypothetical protein
MRRTSQQNSYLHGAWQVMCMQPMFFSMGRPHLGLRARARREREGRRMRQRVSQPAMCSWVGGCACNAPWLGVREDPVHVLALRAVLQQPGAHGGAGEGAVRLRAARPAEDGAAAALRRGARRIVAAAARAAAAAAQVLDGATAADTRAPAHLQQTWT